MTSTEATVEVFWTAFSGLKKTQKDEFVKKMLSDKELLEDLTDLLILRQRRNEQSISLDEYLAKRN